MQRKKVTPAPCWPIPLSQREARAFARLCAKQGLAPELVLRRMVQGYLACVGQDGPPVKVRDFDAMLAGYLDWCTGRPCPEGGLPPSIQAVSRVRSAARARASGATTQSRQRADEPPV